MKHAAVAILCLLSATVLRADLIKSGSASVSTPEGDEHCTGSCTVSLGGFSASAHPEAAYGRVEASATAAATAMIGDAGADAFASFSDSLTFSGFSGPGFASFGWEIFLDPFPHGEAIVMGTTFLETPPNPATVISIPVTPGAAVDIAASVIAGTSIRLGPQTKGALALAELVEIHLTDAAGLPILGASVVSESGTRYPLVTATPEPSALLLFGSVLGAVAALRILRMRA